MNNLIVFLSGVTTGVGIMMSIALITWKPSPPTTWISVEDGLPEYMQDVIVPVRIRGEWDTQLASASDINGIVVWSKEDVTHYCILPEVE